MAGEFIIQSGFLGSAELLAQGFQTGAIAEEEQSLLLLNTLPGFFEEAGLEQDLSRMVLDYRRILSAGRKGDAHKLGLAIAEAIRKQGQGLNSVLRGSSGKVSPPPSRPQREFQYLGKVAWNASMEAVREATQYVLKNHLGNDPSRISTCPEFLRRRFTLADGKEISGFQIVSAVACLEKPGVSVGKAIKKLGGKASIIKILKGKYLGVVEWWETPESLRETIQYILRHYLGNDPSQISSGRFLRGRFSLANGSEVSGRQIVSAVVRLEKPGIRVEEAIEELGGRASVIRILKSKYLGVVVAEKNWQKTPDALKEALQYILRKHLGNDPRRILASPKFLSSRFILADGNEASGYQIIAAVVRLEKPGVRVNKAIEELGGQASVIRILKGKYLGIVGAEKNWQKTPDALRESLQYILKKYLDNDHRQISARPKFILSRFILADGNEVSGYQIIATVVRLEKPGVRVDKAIEELGGLASVIGILKGKYLGIVGAEKNWQRTLDALRETLQYILRKYLDNDHRRIFASKKFLLSRFVLPDGGEVSGVQIVSAVARFEKPGVASAQAIQELGGLAAVVRILKEKYLGLKQPRPPVEVRQWLEEHNYGDLVRNLHQHPGSLQIILTLLAGRELSEVEIREFVIDFSSLNLQTDLRHQPGVPSESPERYLEGLFTLEARWQELSEEDWIDLAKVYVNLLYARFQKEGRVILEELSQKMEAWAGKPPYRLFQHAFRHFQKEQSFKPTGMKTNLKPYQRIAAYEIIREPRGLLGDDTGIGKTIEFLAAVEWLRAKGKVRKAIIIAPNSVKGSWRDQIAEHVERPGKVVVLDSNNKEASLKEARDAATVIVHYEFLRGKTKQELADLLYQADIVGLDEAQEIANPSQKVQQAEAVRRLFGDIPRRWLLTATPYHTKMEHLFGSLSFLYPELFSSFQAFRDAYFKGNGGLLKLQREMATRMIRRTKQTVLTEYTPGQESWDIPRKVMVNPATEGAYTVTEDQAELVRQMFDDFRGWAAKKGLETITHFTHLRYLWNAVIDPALVGEEISTPLYDALDQIVERRIALGQKIVLYAEHHLVLDKLIERYKRYGLTNIDGRITDREERDRRIAGFQKNPDIKILVSGLKVGGTGISLTAADTMIYVERSLSFSVNYQSEDRAHRIDTSRPEKKEVEIIRMVPRYPQGWVATLSNRSERALFEQGTVGEILEERMARLRAAYHLVLDGIMDPTSFDTRMRQFLLGNIKGLNRIDDGKKEFRTHRAVVKELMPLWESWKKTPARRMALIGLSRRGTRAQVSLQPIADAILKTPNFSARDMALLGAMLENGNKYIVSAFLERLPDFMKRLYADGRSFQQWAPVKDHSVDRWVIPILMVADGKDSALWRGVLKELAAVKSRHKRLQLGNTLLVSAFNGLRGDLAWMGDRQTPLETRLDRLNKLGWILALAPKRFPQGVAFETIETIYIDLFYSLFGIPNSTENRARVATLYKKWGHFDQLYGLMSGLRRDPLTYGTEIAKLREIVSHIVAGDYQTWRNKNGAVSYLKNDPVFWQAWSEGTKNSFVNGEGKTVTIEDTDDPQLILEMGALAPDMMNCFNTCGNPEFNHTLIDVLGSRNKRLVVVRRDGKPMAVAVAHIRRGENGKSILYLDRELFRGKYNYRDEMLEHLQIKGMKLPNQPPVASYIHDVTQESDIKVFGTGSFARNEYVEAFHGVRPAAKVFHRARPYRSENGMEKVEIVLPNPGKVTIFSYGTSNRTIQNFVRTLRQNGVVTVVDVRSRPQSQWYPHFNRRALEETLGRSGMGYVWLGDKLGGYPEGYDGNFEKYMHENPNGQFSAGIAELLAVAKKAGGPIVVLCSEGDSERCHRRFIIDHLRAPNLFSPPAAKKEKIDTEHLK